MAVEPAQRVLTKRAACTTVPVLSKISIPPFTTSTTRVGPMAELGSGGVPVTIDGVSVLPIPAKLTTVAGIAIAGRWIASAVTRAMQPADSLRKVLVLDIAHK